MCLRNSGGLGIAGVASLIVGFELDLHAAVNWRRVRRGKSRCFIFLIDVVGSGWKFGRLLVGWKMDGGWRMGWGLI